MSHRYNKYVRRKLLKFSEMYFKSGSRKSVTFETLLLQNPQLKLIIKICPASKQENISLNEDTPNYYASAMFIDNKTLQRRETE